jgi:hypothetical protein
MSEEKTKGAMPNYIGKAEFMKDGVKIIVETAIWVHKDKNDKQYLSLNFGGVNSALFKFEPKPKKTVTEERV